MTSTEVLVVCPSLPTSNVDFSGPVLPTDIIPGVPVEGLRGSCDAPHIKLELPQMNS
jgi:hypothetical protein